MYYSLKYVPIALLAGVMALFCSFKAPSADGEWQLLKEVDGVKFYARILQCQEEGSPHFSMKLENSTASDVKVDMTLLLPEVPAVGPVTRTIEGLEAGTTLEGDCGSVNEALMMQLISPADDIDDVEFSATVTK